MICQVIKVMKNKCDIVRMCPVHVSNVFYSVQPGALYVHVGDDYDESEENDASDYVDDEHDNEEFNEG